MHLGLQWLIKPFVTIIRPFDWFSIFNFDVSSMEAWKPWVKTNLNA